MDTLFLIGRIIFGGFFIIERHESFYAIEYDV